MEHHQSLDQVAKNLVAHIENGSKRNSASSSAGGEEKVNGHTKIVDFDQ